MLFFPQKRPSVLSLEALQPAENDSGGGALERDRREFRLEILVNRVTVQNLLDAGALKLSRHETTKTKIAKKKKV